MTEELNQVLKQRRQKADELADLGVNLYSNTFRPCNSIRDLLIMDSEITDETEPDQGESYTIAGRLMFMRKMGKASFINLQDESGRIQIYVKRDIVGDESYKVFNQSFFGEGVMVAQRDGYPVCDSRETWRWDPGELITDIYDIPVAEDAPDGLFPLYTGMYLEENFERLHIVDEAGSSLGTQVHLTDIRVGVE